MGREPEDRTAAARQIRFLAEIGADFVLWDGTDDVGGVEEKLAIPPDLRHKLSAWAAEFNARLEAAVPGTPLWTAAELDEFDRRGYKLSLEVQRFLGEDYQVDYGFQTAKLRTEVDESTETNGGLA